MRLSGLADLPLHDGSVPAWLLNLMARLARSILSVMVEELGPDRVVERFSDPLWFQAFNNVIGMDWDSSGSTTVTTGILKALTWGDPSFGFIVLGGKGASSRRVPEEAPAAIELVGARGVEPEELARISRIVARVDSLLLQDGYSLYHHAVLLSESGKWTIVQQGMNVDLRVARRYHWHSTDNFYEEPHKAISGVKHERVLNLVDRGLESARKTIVDLVSEGPSRVLDDYARIYRALKGQADLYGYVTPTSTGVVLRASDGRVAMYRPLPLPSELLRRLREVSSSNPTSLDELLLARGVNDKLIRALALVSDLIYSEPPSTRDPVSCPFDPFEYSYAVGGKDGVPFPVDRKLAEDLIQVLEDAVHRARLGERDKLVALRNLSRIKHRALSSYLGARARLAAGPRSETQFSRSRE